MLGGVSPYHFRKRPRSRSAAARPRGRCITDSERNFVLVRLGRCGGFRRNCGWFAAGARLSIFIGRFCGTARPGATRPAAEQLHRFANDAKPGSFLPSLLVVPGVHLQTAFDENRPALFQIFARDLGQPRPKDNIVICLLFPFPPRSAFFPYTALYRDG